MLKYILGLFFIGFIFVAQAKDLTLEVVSEHWPPFIIQNAENVSGIVTKKIREILAPSGINYTINTYPWARSYHLATTKANVLIYSIYKTKQRAPHFKWFCPIHQKTPINIYKLKKNKTNIATLAPLKKAIVGVLRDDNSHNYMLNNGFTAGRNLIISSSEESNISKLLNEKIDVIIQSREALIYRLQGTGLKISDLEAGFELHQKMNTEHCMALSKASSPEMISAVEKAFKLWLVKK